MWPKTIGEIDTRKKLTAQLVIKAIQEHLMILRMIRRNKATRESGENLPTEGDGVLELVGYVPQPRRKRNHLKLPLLLHTSLLGFFRPSRLLLSLGLSLSALKLSAVLWQSPHERSDPVHTGMGVEPCVYLCDWVRSFSFS